MHTLLHRGCTSRVTGAVTALLSLGVQVMLRIAKHQSLHVPPAPAPEDWDATAALAMWRKLQRKPSPQSLDAAGGGGGSGRGGPKGMDHSIEEVVSRQA